MASPAPEELGAYPPPQDDPMAGVGDDDEEGDGDEIMPGQADDSSEEEEEEDADEERRIREGFIVDEDEDEDEEDDEEAERKRRKRRKKHHRRRREEEEDLEEDDLDLLEENTGGTFKKSRLKRLVRRGRSESPPTASSSKRRAVVESSDEDLDDEPLPKVQDIQQIWDDHRDDYDDDADGDIDDFIEYDEDEGGMPMDEQAREERRKERRKRDAELRRKSRAAHPELAGIDANAWAEIHDVFGDGHEYDWALVGDEEIAVEADVSKDTNLAAVFEPSEIRDHLLTEDDNLIRARDTPERMQLTTSSLSDSASISMHQTLTTEDINKDGARWVTLRLSVDKQNAFFSPQGEFQHLQGELVMAVTFALRSMFVDEYEVPYIWTHKRDYISHFDPNNAGARHELLTLPELWRIYALGQKYRSLVERRNSMAASYSRFGVEDSYYTDEIFPAVDSVEMVADTTEWLLMKYKDRKQNEAAFRFHDDEEAEGEKKHKMPSRVSAYELAKKSIVSKLADGFGLPSHEIVLNFVNETRLHYVDNQNLDPTIYAEQFADPNPMKAQPPEELLRRARMIIATELGRDPLLREHMRQLFKNHAMISISPTDKGIMKIDEHHPYFDFKYLANKPINKMLQSSQFLYILKAEQELLVNVSIFLPPDVKANFEHRLIDAFSSDALRESARAWNEERSRVVNEVMEQHLIPAALKWTREYVREEEEDYLANRCGEQLRKRIDVAPYSTSHMKLGDVPSVLAVSWGKGDPQKDAICVVFMDDGGRMREWIKIDNLVDTETRDEFIDIIRRRKPDVILIGGLSMATTKLSQRVKEIVAGRSTLDAASAFGEPSNDTAFDIPVRYIPDELARIFHHSARSKSEFGALPPTARYCVGLARYAQSPLNEYAAVGSDITALSYDEDDQHLIPKEKLLNALEQALVDVTNKVGVDINKSVTDRYYQFLLPFVCGLGPRKARELVTKIDNLGGSLVNRNQFIKSGVLTTKIFLNAAGFLRIVQEQDDLKTKHRLDDENAPDPLDDTRIHPEDYELARKMATDALELDEEDVHDEHPSHVVGLIMQDPENDKKLSELNLDEFAVSLYQANQEMKRHTLNVIRDELLNSFSEQRQPFPPVNDWHVLTMLSGETARTLNIGCIVAVQVYRTKPGGAASVRLDSGIEGFINPEFMFDPGATERTLAKAKSIPAIIIEVTSNLEQDEFMVELSSRPSDMAEGDKDFRAHPPDLKYWNEVQREKDVDILARKKRAEVDRTRRVIKHPNFMNFNTAQAEQYLDNQQRGDVVIRPSSKGIDHLAVTWKVDDKLYQHIDITELNYDPDGQNANNQYLVDAAHTYTDLDELIVNHVQAMARRVEELMAHDRFKPGTEDDLHLFLKNQLLANPAKSMYGFTLNRKRPGHFNLCFLANKDSAVQTWPVRVTPEAYYLFEAHAVGVPELCDAFKVRHLHQSQSLAAGGGKTPYGAGQRTPARPGYATPGRASVLPSRTPNPYGAGTRTPNPYGGATPAPNYPPPPTGFGAQTPYNGYQTPSHHGFGGPSALPAGMNPARAAMINNSRYRS